MKSLFSSKNILSCLLILLGLACNKPDPGDNYGATVDRDLNRIGIMEDEIVLWPQSGCSFFAGTVVEGQGRYASNGPLEIFWRVISGPNIPLVEMGPGYSIDTKLFKVSGLTIGVYELEVSFDKKYGNFNKDTARIIVDTLSKPTIDFILTKQNWVPETSSYFWGSWIYIRNIYDKIPPESAFRAFIKRGNNSNWEELPGNSKYDYRFEYAKGSQYTGKGEITIWSENMETDNPDIKLIY